MNERIEKIAKEHGFIHEFMSTGEKNDALKKYEKFAELIVQEVFSKLEDEGFEVYEPVIKAVKKHFGVEE